jgi:hypothetical protein
MAQVQNLPVNQTHLAAVAVVSKIQFFQMVQTVHQAVELRVNHHLLTTQVEQVFRDKVLQVEMLFTLLPLTVVAVAVALQQLV